MAEQLRDPREPGGPPGPEAAAGATRLDLLAGGWLNTVEDHRRRLRGALTTGAALYPIVAPRWPAESRGTLYGTRREPPAQPAGRDRDEEIEMDDDAGTPAERTTYARALERALHHARRASEEGRTRLGRECGSQLAEATTARSWAAIAELLRRDETRARTSEYTELLTRELRAQGLTPTGRARRAEVPPLQPLPVAIAEPAPSLSTALGAVDTGDEEVPA